MLGVKLAVSLAELDMSSAFIQKCLVRKKAVRIILVRFSENSVMQRGLWSQKYC